MLFDDEEEFTNLRGMSTPEHVTPPRPVTVSILHPEIRLTRKTHVSCHTSDIMHRSIHEIGRIWDQMDRIFPGENFKSGNWSEIHDGATKAEKNLLPYY